MSAPARMRRHLHAVRMRTRRMRAPAADRPPVRRAALRTPRIWIDRWQRC